MLKFILIFACPFAFAASQDFYALTEKLAQKCSFEKGVCSNPYSARVLTRDTHPGIFKRFDKKAGHLAVGWGDTILEGDYHAFGGTRASRALQISSGDKIVAYQLEYYEEAIDTELETCERDDSSEEDSWIYFGTCKLGRIYEVSWVSPDLSEDVGDYERYATFFASAKEKAEKGYSRDQ